MPHIVVSHASGASGDSVDLLPSPWQADWTKSLPTDDGHLMDQIFSFDGAHNAVEVPAGHFDHHLGDHFTISMWMKHDFPEGGPVKSHDSPKEHILCMSDGDGECMHVDLLLAQGQCVCRHSPTLPPSRGTHAYTILEWNAMPVDFAVSDSGPI